MNMMKRILIAIVFLTALPLQAATTFINEIDCDRLDAPVYLIYQKRKQERTIDLSEHESRRSINLKRVDLLYICIGPYRFVLNSRNFDDGCTYSLAATWKPIISRPAILTLIIHRNGHPDYGKITLRKIIKSAFYQKKQP